MNVNLYAMSFLCSSSKCSSWLCESLQLILGEHMFCLGLLPTSVNPHRFSEVSSMCKPCGHNIYNSSFDCSFLYLISIFLYLYTRILGVGGTGYTLVWLRTVRMIFKGKANLPPGFFCLCAVTLSGTLVFTTWVAQSP